MTDDNPYASDDEPEKQDKSPGCATVLGGLLLLATVGFMIVFMVGSIAFDIYAAHYPPQPEFTVGDRVNIISGVHRGRHGTIVGGRPDTLFNRYGYQYMIEIPNGYYGDIEWAEDYELEAR